TPRQRPGTEAECLPGQPGNPPHGQQEQGGERPGQHVRPARTHVHPEGDDPEGDQDGGEGHRGHRSTRGRAPSPAARRPIGPASRAMTAPTAVLATRAIMITKSQVTYVKGTPGAPYWRVADVSARGR